MVKQDRSFGTWFILTLITCGIYNLFFLHSLIKDVNTICEGDGKKTSGLLALILLGIVTCGIYTFWWYYSLGNRLSENADKFGLKFSENGTTILMWYLFGSLLCGIGPLIGFNIIIKNTNALAGGYNANSR